MSRGKWIPFRGDNYSKENSREYIPKRRMSFLERVFTAFIFLLASGYLIYFVISDIANWHTGTIIFWIVFLSIILVIVYFAAKDAQKINQKRKDVPSENNIDDD